MRNHYNFGLVGQDITHSLSPQIFKNLGHQYNLSIHYNLFDEQSIDHFKNHDHLDGFNITAPFKESVLSIADILSPEVKATRCANLLKRTTSGWMAFNTDLEGIKRALPDLRNNEVLILGSGAMARTLLAHFKENKPRKISVCCRDSLRSRRLRKENSTFCPFYSFDQLDPSLTQGSFVINALSRGITPPLSLENISFFYDLNYQNSLTLNRAIPSQDGLSLLIWQALESFRIWTNNSYDQTAFPLVKKDLQCP